MEGQIQNKIIEKLNRTYNEYKYIVKDRYELERRLDENFEYDDKILLKNNINNIGYYYLCHKIILLNKFDKEQNNSQTKTYYITVESDESKKIREQNEIKERNRQAASNELPNFLDKIKTNFFPILDGNISNMEEKIEEKINMFSRDYLKIFLQNLIKAENIKNKLINDLRKKSEKILINY